MEHSESYSYPGQYPKIYEVEKASRMQIRIWHQLLFRPGAYPLPIQNEYSRKQDAESELRVAQYIAKRNKEFGEMTEEEIKVIEKIEEKDRKARGY